MDEQPSREFASTYTGAARKDCNPLVSGTVSPQARGDRLANDGSHGSRSIRAEARTKLLAAIARARRWLEDLISGRAASIEAIAVREGVSERSARMALSLAFLAPAIVQATVDATLPRGFGVSRLTEMPASWAEQRKVLGLAASRF